MTFPPGYLKVVPSVHYVITNDRERVGPDNEKAASSDSKKYRDKSCEGADNNCFGDYVYIVKYLNSGVLYSLKKGNT
jgi:hypothetical protein